MSDNDYLERLKKIRSIFTEYSPKEIAIFLCALNLWLPNISALIQINLLGYIFLSIKVEDFSQVKKLQNYEGFKELFESISQYFISFPTLEDFIPETDWGDVKYRLSSKNYKIFYGGDLTDTYTHLTWFELYHGTYDNDYKELVKRSPLEELEYFLSLQHKIITSITKNKTTLELDIELGNLELPSEEFIIEVEKLFESNVIEETKWIDDYSLQLGVVDIQTFDIQNFVDAYFDGSGLPLLFIGNEEKLLLFPRRINAVVTQKWTDISKESLDKINKKIEKKRNKHEFEWSIANYTKARVDEDEVFILVSAINNSNIPRKTVFNSVIHHEDKFLLVYLPNEKHDVQKLADEIKNNLNDLNESIALLQTSNPKLGLLGQGQVVEFRPAKEGAVPRIELLTLIPIVSTEVLLMPVIEDLQGKVMYILDFISIIDEIKNAKELLEYLKFDEEYGDKLFPGNSALDKFAGFRISQSLLVKGANEPTNILLDPNMGSNTRYEWLSDFWQKFPEENYFGHPRTWKILEDDDSIILESKRFNSHKTIHLRIGKTAIFITSATDLLSREQLKITVTVLQMIEDCLKNNKEVIENHTFFQKHQKLNINPFAESKVSKSGDFKHLNHLLNKGKQLFTADISIIDDETYGIRLVFDDKILHERLLKAKDRRVEIELLQEILKQINNIEDDKKFNEILSQLEERKSLKPRFKYFQANKHAAFPEDVPVNSPEEVHFLKAKKRISELAKEGGLEEGDYGVEDAKVKIDTIKNSLLEEITKRINKYSFDDSIFFLITYNDALNQDYEAEKLGIENALTQEVDYNPAQRLAKKHSEYVRTGQNYRYLIEKFVQLQPKGSGILKDESFQEIVALIDWLLVFYNASDALHYGVNPTGVNVDRDFLVDVQFEKGFQTKQDDYGEEYHSVELGLKGNKTDFAEPSLSSEEIYSIFDEAFLKDMGFKVKDMFAVLYILGNFPNYTDVPLNTVYTSSFKDLKDICNKAITVDSPGEEVIEKILKFLILEKQNVLKVTGQKEDCIDLPIWEHAKRYYRYSIRPIIEHGEELIWGPYSAKKVVDIWSGAIHYGTLPINLDTPNIKEAVAVVKKSIDDSLTKKTYEVLNRCTKMIEKDLFLHKRFPKESYPSDLGDYDVIGYIEDKNIIIMLECSDVLPAFCLKDAKRQRQSIFGTEEEPSRHMRQIGKRTEYLENNLEKVANSLGWNIADKAKLKIVPVYLSRISYWWTYSTPYPTNIQFTSITTLSEFIDNL